MPVKDLKLCRNVRGFSLIEVMIALLVTSAGALGFAAVEAAMINNTAVSRYQSMAAFQVSSLASSMAIDRAYWQGLTAPVLICVGMNNGNVATQYLKVTQSCPSAISSSSGAMSTASADCSTASNCTPVEVASYSVRRWMLGLAQPGAFAQPAAAISCAAATGQPVTCVVRLSWSEKNIALTKLNGAETGQLAAGTTVTNSYSQVVQP